MELTEKQKRLLWILCNNAQGQGAKYLMQYEGSLIVQKQPSDEVTKWYEETKEEFRELSELKKLFTDN